MLIIPGNGPDMGHDWIIDVLADMRSFAKQNEMPLLCAQLDDVIEVAAAEVADRRAGSVNRQVEELYPTAPRQLD